MATLARRAKDAAKQVPFVRSFLTWRDRASRAGKPFAPPGHFYSPLPDLDAVRADEARIFASPSELPGIELRVDAQLALLGALKPHAADLPFRRARRAGLRFFYDNGAFGPGDAQTYAAMLLDAKPKRVVEVGAGWTTCLLLDLRERQLKSCEVTTIEPFPDFVRTLLARGDEQTIKLLAQRAQDVPLDVYTALDAGDVLFIDSSHVSKVGSDVNHLLFEVVPRLRSGVLVHFHDVFFPFEYPTTWVYEGRAWSEAYLLRAFLQFNDAFEIVLFNNFLGAKHKDALVAAIPGAAEDPGGSLWLRRR